MARTAAPKGVRFIVDDEGEKTGVVIDLIDNAELWEGIYDRAVARSARRELEGLPRVSCHEGRDANRVLGDLTSARGLPQAPGHGRSQPHPDW